MNDVTVIILTLNEEIHLERCIRSVQPFAHNVIVVDSGSTDRTREITQSLGAHWYQNPWVNYASQLNWALDHTKIETGWVMRLDADEYVTPELACEIADRLVGLEPAITGVALRRRVYFMGRWIRHGGYYPIVLLRLLRTGGGRCEERWMDEHLQVDSGRVITFEHDFVDDNLRTLTWWTSKHNDYATREAVDLLNLRHGFLELRHTELAGQARGKRWLKQNVYARLPQGIRPIFYFFYRYFLCLGLLDGYEGFLFHTLQGFWYRFLVDAKVYEIERRARQRGVDLCTVLKQDYGVPLRGPAPNPPTTVS